MDLRFVQGTSRSVVLVGPWALKLPWGLGRQPVRGWLANRSEWRQRRRPDVCRPRCTVGHVLLVMPRAEFVASELVGNDAHVVGARGVLAVAPEDSGAGRDETKPSSWGWFRTEWLLVDYDRAWEQQDRGLVGRLYWGNQERLARK